MAFRRVLRASLIAFVAVGVCYAGCIAKAPPGASTMVSRAVVTASCSKLPAALSFSFTPYDVFASNGQFVTGGNTTINCTKGAQPTWSFDNGTYGLSNANCAPFHCRNMGNGSGGLLAYVAIACYSPAQINGSNMAEMQQYCTGMDQPDATNVPVPAANGTATQEQVNLFFYAILPGKQDVPVGSYSDSFTMTLNY